MTDAAFQLSRVSVRLGGIDALAGVDLRLERGRTSVLLGPSGSGKSTVLRLLLGLVRADAGRATALGRALPRADEPEDREALQALRRSCGYVIQEGGLFPHLTCEDNVALAARHLGWSPARRRERVAELGALVGLPDDVLGRHPGELSGGQRQRVALVRALFLDPEALLLDEPLGALDPLIRRDLQDELRELFASLGKTVVLVTHDLAEAAHFAVGEGTIALLREGALVQRGAIEDLVHRPADEFVGRFVSAQRGLAGIVP